MLRACGVFGAVFRRHRNDGFQIYTTQFTQLKKLISRKFDFKFEFPFTILSSSPQPTSSLPQPRPPNPLGGALSCAARLRCISSISESFVFSTSLSSSALYRSFVAASSRAWDSWLWCAAASFRRIATTSSYPSALVRTTSSSVHSSDTVVVRLALTARSFSNSTVSSSTCDSNQSTFSLASLSSASSVRIRASFTAASIS